LQRNELERCVTALRVFFALWPDADVRDQLAGLARAAAERAHGRAPPPENLHMTLVFVGEVPQDSVAPLQGIGGRRPRRRRRSCLRSTASALSIGRASPGREHRRRRLRS
jgi:hypothetical protein